MDVQYSLPELMRPKELCPYLGCNLQKAYDIIKARDFPSIRIGGRWYIIKDKFIDWLDKQSHKPKC